MDPIGEHPLDRSPSDAPSAERGRRRGLIAAAAVLLVLAGVTFLYVWNRQAATVPADSDAPAATGSPGPAGERQPLGPPVKPAPLPPLGETDPLVRQLLGALSDHPKVGAWLATDDLVRRFVASLDNVAGGAAPTPHLRALAPDGPFEVEPRGGTLVIAERAFTRYDALADAVASIDPSSLAELYSRLRPRLQEAYVELGYPGGDVDRAVERALIRLLDTPTPEGRVEVIEGVVSYRYRRQDLESLSDAQKQLVRMGPRNVRLIKGQLWALARALGIPSERLPAIER